MSCTHPHIFRLQTKDPYRCLACGNILKIVPDVSPPMTQDYQKGEFMHMLEVDDEDIFMLHVIGCDSWLKKIDPDCQFAKELLNNPPKLKKGEYEMYIKDGGKPIYIPVISKKPPKSKEAVK